jgi:hypothetical protein
MASPRGVRRKMTKFLVKRPGQVSRPADWVVTIRSP